MPFRDITDDVLGNVKGTEDVEGEIPASITIVLACCACGLNAPPLIIAADGTLYDEDVEGTFADVRAVARRICPNSSNDNVSAVLSGYAA